MKILFTGSSSFSGYWFIKTLAEKGHDVYSIFTRKRVDDYHETRKQRIQRVISTSTPVWECSFGDEKFLSLLDNEFDVLCHHAADVTNYKSDDFDFIKAVQNNTSNIKQVFEKLRNTSCKTVILTGSVFEQNEGTGSFKAFSPYGLSKGLTADVFRYYAENNDVNLGKFVIPNPIGPFEEFRFTAFLMNQWKNNEIPCVKTPKYVRDNIHVSLLAETYNYFVKQVANDGQPFQKINPSGYVGTQGEFTKIFSEEMQKRTALACEFTLNDQKDFTEPRIRVNYHKADEIIEDWDEQKAWDEMADYYMGKM